MSQPSDRRPGGRPARRFDGPSDRGAGRGAAGGPPNRSFSRPGGRPSRPGGPRPSGPRFERDGGGGRDWGTGRDGGAGRSRPDRDAPGSRYGDAPERRPYEPRGGGERSSYSPREQGPYGARPSEGRGPQGRPLDRRPRRPGERPAFQPRRPGDRFGADRPAFRPRDGQRPAPFAAPKPPRQELGAAGEQRGEGDHFAGAAPTDLIWGRHTAQAVLESGRPVHRIWCTPEMRFSPRFLQLLREAKASGVLVEEVTWARLGQISGGAVHQGIVLQPAAAETLDLGSLIDGCRGLGEAPLLLAVDGLTDPQNLGAIVRSAEALGAHGMVLPQRRNAGLTGSVAKVAAGALEHLPIARVVNLNRSLDTLKQEGYRVIGLAGEGSVSLEEADLEGPLVVVTGSEGDGLSLLTRRNCDQLVRIPLRGATPSLNASVATALLLYEVARRSWMKGLSGTSPAPRLVRPALPTPAPRPEAAQPDDAEATVSAQDASVVDRSRAEAFDTEAPDTMALDTMAPDAEAPDTEAPELEPFSVEASVGDSTGLQAFEADAQVPEPASAEAPWEAPATAPSWDDTPPAQAPPEHTGSALDPALSIPAEPPRAESRPPAAEAPEAEALLEFPPYQEDPNAPFATDVRL